jgi:hypothetical protein
MKGTDAFKEAVENYLIFRSSTDELFAKTYAKPEKNIDDCVTYILTTVKKSGCEGFTDDEIFGMAVHYYDEDKIDIGDKKINAKVVVNQKVEKKPDVKAEPKKAEAKMKVVKTIEKKPEPETIPAPSFATKTDKKPVIVQQTLF